MAGYIEYWYQALAMERGVVLKTDNPKLLVAKLYAARKAAMDPDLEVLSIVLSPLASDQVWIIRNGSAQSS